MTDGHSGFACCGDPFQTPIAKAFLRAQLIGSKLFVDVVQATLKGQPFTHYIHIVVFMLAKPTFGAKILLAVIVALGVVLALVKGSVNTC